MQNAQRTVALYLCAFLSTICLPAFSQINLSVHNPIWNSPVIQGDEPGDGELKFSYTIAVENYPELTLPLQIHVQLVDSKNQSYYNRTITEQIILDKRGNTQSIQKKSLPLNNNSWLPEDKYTLIIEAILDPMRIGGILGNTKNVDINQSDNQTSAEPTMLLHTSGDLFFGEIQTKLTTIGNTQYNNGKWQVQGNAKWNDTTDVSWVTISASRNNQTGALHLAEGTASFEPPENPFQPNGSQWSLLYSQGTLSINGAQANLQLPLPDGIAYKFDEDDRVSYTEEPLPFEIVSLSQDMSPETIESGRFMEWMSEEVPFTVKSKGYRFTIDGDLFLPDAEAKYRFDRHSNGLNAPRFPTNDGYFLGGYVTQGEITIAPDGLQASVDISHGNFETAFPYKAQVHYDEMVMRYEQGKLVASGVEVDEFGVGMDVFNSACGDASCEDSPAAQMEEIDVQFSDSGLINPEGAWFVSSGIEPGFEPQFNTYSFAEIQSAAWFMPGIYLPNDKDSSFLNSISHYLYAVRDQETHAIHRNGQLEFFAGDGLFAGLNLMPEELTGKEFKVQISQDEIELEHAPESKLYIRRAGYTGIVNAVNEEKRLIINRDPTCGNNEGYPVRLDSFGQAYLDNLPHSSDSKINGEITLEWPSSINIPFEEMALDACGQFTGGKVPAGAREEEKILAYWQAPLFPSALEFRYRENADDPDAPCAINEDARTLWITSVNPIERLEDDPMMQINLKPCGVGRSLIADLPGQTDFDGYNANVRNIYLTKWDETNDANGAYSIIAGWEAPVFHELQVQALARGSSLWIASGRPWNEDTDPDMNFDGFVDTLNNAAGPATEVRYTSYADQHPVNVRTDFGQVIPIRYDLFYDPFSKQFQTHDPNEQDLIIMDIISAVDYLNPERTKISFGVDLNPLPELDLASLGNEFGEFNQRINESFLQPVRDNIERANQITRGDITQVVRPDVKNYFKVNFTAPLLDNAQANLDTLEGDARERLHQYIESQLSAFGLADREQFWMQSVKTEINDSLIAMTTAIDGLKADADRYTPIADALLQESLRRLGLDIVFDVEDLTQPVRDIQNLVMEDLSTAIEEPYAEIKDEFDEAGAYIHDAFPHAQIEAWEADLVTYLVDSIMDEIDGNLDRLPRISSDQMANWTTSFIFNRPQFQAFSTHLTSRIDPINTAILNKAQGLLNGINHAVQSHLKELTGVVDGVAADIKGAFGFRGANITGTAISNRLFIEELNMDALFQISVPHEVDFNSYLVMHRFKTKSDDGYCGGRLDNTDVIDIEIGSRGLELGWFGQSTAVDIAIYIKLLNGSLGMVGGSIIAQDNLDYEVVELEHPEFGIAIGSVENYLWADGNVFWDEYELGGGFFFGTSCTDEPLRHIDERTADLLNLESMSGAFISAEGSFPIVDLGCALRVTAEGGIALWYFHDSNTYGGRLTCGVSGSGACTVSVKGKLDLDASKIGDAYAFHGTAWVAGGYGWCEKRKWTTPRRAIRDSWCLACAFILDLIYSDEDGWQAGYDYDCG